ncbi:DUF3747 domain-containing protein [Synechococcus sp. M16CYN]|uniref:DUF3747 domain-containing protein n=1 Tax=Synechococcus sp. M16CYN TaxID=3103139 RepID=UPI00333F7C92
MVARFLPAAAGFSFSVLSTVPVLAQGSLFTAIPVEESNFVLVAAPIGRSARSQLNIYEQRVNKRPCFSVSRSTPAMVSPLLSGFDFTGICNRYTDSNGYSLRLGEDDMGTNYRFTVVKTGGDLELLAIPTLNPSKPIFTVARSGGIASGFVQLKLQPGWKLMRRAYGEKALGHLYIYQDITRTN